MYPYISDHYYELYPYLQYSVGYRMSVAELGNSDDVRAIRR